jgi:hypothetical protein
MKEHRKPFGTKSTKKKESLKTQEKKTELSLIEKEIEKIYEPFFYKKAFGYRKGSTPHQAIKEIIKWEKESLCFFFCKKREKKENIEHAHNSGMPTI